MIQWMALSFMSPNIGIYLDGLGHPSTTLACVLSLTGLCYGGSAPFMYLLTIRMKKRGVIVIGIVTMSSGIFCIGGEENIIDHKYKFAFIIIGFIAFGFANSFMAIPCLPEMIDSIEEDEKLNHLYDREILHGVISGLFVSL